GKGFDPIGFWEPYGSDSLGFSGEFLGQDYSIYNLLLNRPTENAVALFACLSRGARINGLNLVKTTVHGQDYVGMFAAEIYSNRTSDIVIDNCHCYGDVQGRGIVGGFCGEAYAFYQKLIITNCSTNGKIVGEGRVGGFVGRATSDVKTLEISYSSSDCIVVGTVQGGNGMGGFCGTASINWSGKMNIEQCISTGLVSGKNILGGFVGKFSAFADENNFEIVNCASLGSVVGENHIGGFCGVIAYENDISTPMIEECYSIGAVEGEFEARGFCGIQRSIEKSDMNYCYYDAETSGRDSSDGGTGKITAQMKTRSTFETWDFDEIWDIDPEINNGYPFLRCLPTVSVEEFVSPQAKKLDIIPNPAQDQIQVSIDEEFAVISLVKISDLSGRLMLTSKTDRINISELNSGIYI
ncbi:MAG: T9SS type A sorting domain-containing protein, partial [Chlorobi bacterium]|nr:T9SS type A sorting domain-containing protein [Chlorobiota bacterium]